MRKNLDQEPEGGAAAAGAFAIADAIAVDADLPASSVSTYDNRLAEKSRPPADTAAPSSSGVVSPPPRARSLLDVFSATAVRCGDGVAVDAAERTLTYTELSKESTQLAGQLRQLGIGPGDRVGVRVASGTADLYVAILGVLTAGAAYVPVDADDPAERAEELWGRAEASAVIEDALSIRQLAPARGAERELTIDDDAWVIFTSGSTGAPKGVAVSHRAAAAFVDAEAQLWSVERGDRVLAGLSVGFDASCEEIWLAWRHGAALVPAPRQLVRSGADLGPWISGRGISVVSTVPTLAAMWEPSALEHVRLLILGGEACPEPLAWELSEGREVWNTYGPTEATVVTTAARITPGTQIGIGWPLSGWKAAVVDQRGHPVPVGEDGELVIGGVGLGRYLDGELDAERFAALPALGWSRAYRTGDIVRETIDGLQFVGRRDDQVKIGGRRIELGELDAQLNAVPGVKAAMTAVRTSAAENKVIVGYVVSEEDPSQIRATLAQRLPDSLVPMIVALPELPRGRSGKVERKALPWPPPQGAIAEGSELIGTAAWVAERWVEQLGPIPIGLESDFFDLGGSSLAAAKLVSKLRERYPAIAVAEIYEHRRLGQLCDRLEDLEKVEEHAQQDEVPRRVGWGALQLLGVFVVQIFASPQWLLAILAMNQVTALRLGPRVGWGWLIGGWLVFASVPGRAAMLLTGRKLLLRKLRPGRYSRHSWLMFKIWLLERLAGAWRLEGLAGTPWAARYARLCGHKVGRGARLFTLPPVASLVTVGEYATVEGDVDMEGFWLEGDDLVVGEIHVGDRARVGALSVLMPGADVGSDAELEPGTVVSGKVPAGERWAGSPGRYAGGAGEGWPVEEAPRPPRARLWKLMYGLGMGITNVLPLAAATPGLLLVAHLAPGGSGPWGFALQAITVAPLLVVSFVLSYGLLVALVVRAVSPMLRPGWHPEEGSVRWSWWLTDALMGAANDTLFPLYLSVFTRWWLRILGIKVGEQAEISVTSGMNCLTTIADTSFAADAVVFSSARSRLGWLHVGPIDVGSGSFLGNGAILEDATEIGDDSLVGVLTSSPRKCPDGTSWFGSPAFELPRRAELTDPSRTTNPPRKLVFARGVTEVVRIIVPSVLSLVLASFAFGALDSAGVHYGALAMIALAPLTLVAAGVIAVALTVALKWVLMGRYRAGAYPFWSFFVWRDEIMNTCQERLAGTWLLGSAQATPLMSIYLRLMGAKVGRDVWCETMTITEFDMVELGDGCVVNRHGIVQTHLFHDRLLQIGPARLGARSTLGPISAMLPDSTLGDGSSVGARSVVMRGEQLPPRTSWHGTPVVAK